jgi:hypothetical protein
VPLASGELPGFGRRRARVGVQQSSTRSPCRDAFGGRCGGVGSVVDRTQLRPTQPDALTWAGAHHVGSTRLRFFAEPGASPEAPRLPAS